MEQDLYVYLDNYEVPPRIAMVQDDTDRVLCIHPMDFEFHVSYTATIYFERENGTLYHIDSTTISGNVAKFDASQLITSPGNVYAQMVVTTPTGDVSSFAFIVHVQKSAKGTPQTPEEGLTFDEYLNRSEEAAERAETAAEQAEGLVGEVSDVRALAENNDRRISNIEELLDGYDYTTDIQTETAYQRDVPEKALKNAVVAMVGGMSRRCTNLWDEEWEVGGLNASGQKADASNRIRTKNYIPVNGSTTYTLICVSGNFAITMAFYDSNKNFIALGYPYMNGSFGTPSNAKYILFTPVPAYGAIYNNDISIVEGTSGTYEPYTPNIINANLSEIESIGSNLWDEEWESGSYNLDSGEKTLSPNRIRAIGMIEIFPNAALYSTSNKLNMLFFNSNKEYLGRDKCLFNRNDFVTPSDAYYMTFYSDTDYGTSYNHDIAIVKGTSGTYKPYRGTIGSNPFPSEVASKMHGINSEVYDEVELVPSVFENMKDIDLGTPNWAYYSASGVFYAVISDMRVHGKALSDTFYNSDSIHSVLADKCFSTNNNGFGSSAYIFVKDTSFGSDNIAFKEAMSGVILHYEAVSGGTDYEAVVMKKKVGEFELSDASYTKAQYGDDKWYQARNILRDADKDVNLDFVCDSPQNVTRVVVYSSGDVRIYAQSTDNDLTGTIFYKLATPKILDVSDYFEPYGNSLEVEGGGSIITHNADDTYKVGIPMTMAYMISLKGENL